MRDSRDELREEDEPKNGELDPNAEAGFIAEKKVITPDATANVFDAQVAAKEKANLEARKQLREVYDDSKANLSEIISHDVMHEETTGDIESDEFVKNYKMRRSILRFCLVLCLGILVVLGVFKFVRSRRTIEDIPAPVQVDLAEAEDGHIDHRFEVEDGYVELTYLATYDIKGLVVYVDDYDNLWANLFRTQPEGTRVAEIAMPRDLGIAWGDVAAHANEFKWGHGYRDLITTPKSGRSWRDDNGDDLMSNNHIIIEPGSELHDKLMKVKNRDYIEIKGYLVSGSFVDTKYGYIDSFHSSMTRSDVARMITNRITTCEIIYLTDIEWLD